MLRLNDFKCKCGVKEIMHNDGESVVCHDCGMEMEKLPPIFRINMGPAGAYGYYDDNLDCYIHTNRQRREECLRQGVTPKGDTPKSGEAWV